MQNIIVHCKPSLLETVQQLNLTYRDYYDEVVLWGDAHFTLEEVKMDVVFGTSDQQGMIIHVKNNCSSFNFLF